MKKRRVNFSLLRANEVGNTEALLSILWASVVRKCTFGCRPLACGRVSTGPVDVLPLACGLASTGQWTTPEGANLINGSTAL